jgi:hypothetical protein
LVSALIVAGAARAVAEQAKSAAPERRTAVAKLASPSATLVAREGPGKDWRLLKQQEAIHSGDLLVGLPGAVLETSNGAVRLSLLEDIAQVTPFPVIESAVVLHDTPGVDLDFTLDRGRVEVVNRKAKGSARVRVRFHQETWELTLADPGSEVALEIYGRWARGARFTKTPAPEDVPTTDLVLLVLKGPVDLKAGSRQHAMSAPPGPAYFHWDNLVGQDAGPSRLERLPDWADPKASLPPEAKTRVENAKAGIERLRQRLLSKPVAAALAETLQQENDAQLAVYAMGALDDLPRLVDALGDARRGDVRENAVTALRHWIGRGPGQDLKVYQMLVEAKKYPPGQAEIVMQLLHSLGDADLSRTETYEALIAYLGHDKVAIRELAKWHLYRLAAAVAKDIPYDAAAPAAERERAIARWKKLLEEGKLPPKS